MASFLAFCVSKLFHYENGLFFGLLSMRNLVVFRLTILQCLLSMQKLCCFSGLHYKWPILCPTKYTKGMSNFLRFYQNFRVISKSDNIISSYNLLLWIIILLNDKFVPSNCKKLYKCVQTRENLPFAKTR